MRRNVWNWSRIKLIIAAVTAFVTALVFATGPAMADTQPDSPGDDAAPSQTAAPAQDTDKAAPEKDNAEQAHEISAHNISLRLHPGTNLRGLDLHKQKLRGKDLHGADLRQADMHGAHLEKTKLHHSKLDGADLHGVTAHYADFHKSSMRGTILHHSHINHASFNDTDMTGAIMHRSEMHYSSFKRAKLTGAIMHHSHMNHAAFNGADLSHAVAHHVEMHHAKFQHANLTGISMHHSVLHHSKFHYANLTDASLHHSDLSYSMFHHAKLDGAKIHRSNLTRAKLPHVQAHGVSMHHSKFVKANLKGADFGPREGVVSSSLRDASASCNTQCSGSDLSGSSFVKANLSGASFLGADLSGVDFTGANLLGANFTGADLTKAILVGATLIGADFSGAITTGVVLSSGTTLPTPPTSGALCFNSGTSVALATGLIATSFTAPDGNGAGSISLVGPRGVTLNATYQCNYTNPRVRYNSVNITINSVGGSFSSPVTGLTVNTAGISGQISLAYGGNTSWNVHTSFQLQRGDLLIAGGFSINSASDWSLTAQSGTGQVVSTEGSYAANSFNGTLTFADGSYSGSLNALVNLSSHAFFQALPNNWTKSGQISVSFSKSGSDVTANESLSLSATSGSDSVQLSGQWEPSGYQLTGGGTLYINSTPVTVKGSYQSKGWDGSSAAAWSVTGTISNAALPGGAQVQSGSISLVSGTPGFTGSATIQPAANTSFGMATSMTYTDSQDWTFTVSPTQTGSSWSPPGLTGLTINPSSISGTITSSAGSIAWNLSVASVTWNNIVTGGTLTSGYTITNTCPLTSPLSCGSTSGIFLGMTNGSLAIGSVNATVQGAFLTDGSWGLLSGSSSGSRTFNGPESTSISLSSPTVSIWKGGAAPEIYSGLVMPNVNGSGLGLQMCAAFSVTLPYLGASNANGCVSVSRNGIAVGQVGINATTGAGTASVSGGSGNVSVNGAAFAGWAWTDLSSVPSMSLTNGLSKVSVSLQPDLSTVTGNVTLPGAVMSALGFASASDTALPALGTFSDSSFTTADLSFQVSASLPLNINSNNFSLNDLTISIGKSGSNYNFSIALDASYNADNGKFPVTVAFTIQNASLMLSLSAKGYGTSSAPCQTTCDGVNSALTNPQTGYVYLSNSYMQIPGLHLWYIAGQLEIVDGAPGFGITGSTYLDPAQMSKVIHGTAWMWSNSVVNISDLSPCMKFGFTSPSPSTTYVQIQGGVFQTSTFAIGIAPRGCTVGQAVLPAGSTFMLDTSLGSASISLNMAIGRDANGPTFTAQDSITSLVLGGITFSQVSLNVAISSSSQSVSYICNFTLPNSGTFNSNFAVSMNGAGHIQLDGNVSLANWTVSASNFGVTSFNYAMSMDTSTGYFSSSTSGQLTMGAHTGLNFSGTIQVTNNVLQVLNFYFDYMHGGFATVITLSYSSSTHLITGSYQWGFQKETSKTILSHKYVRHANITIYWGFSISTVNPSAATITLSGSMSGDNISGSVGCTLSTSSADDSAYASIHIDISGHKWDDSWSW